ncbi:hypothetical protein [Desulfovibrio inopinatus]|uniref:hypothetical protein n=1 Tax=Desulfovibrio inopinatus TaxID=102109 RepID=UPI00042233E3|nr:hypothetical protein [Desulfovibrio inopinatus]
MKQYAFLLLFLMTFGITSAFAGDCALYGTVVERKSETCYLLNVDYGVTDMPGSAPAGTAPLPFEENGHIEVCSDDSKLQRALNKAMTKSSSVRIEGNCVYSPKYLAVESIKENN